MTPLRGSSLVGYGSDQLGGVSYLSASLHRSDYVGCSLFRRGVRSEALKSQYFDFERDNSIILASEAETSTTPCSHFSARKRFSLPNFSYVNDSQNHKVDDKREGDRVITPTFVHESGGIRELDLPRLNEPIT